MCLNNSHLQYIQNWNWNSLFLDDVPTNLETG